MAVSSLLLKDFIAEQSNAPGTGTYNLGIAVAGRQSWVSAFANGATAYYYATDGIQFECGIGTLTYGTPNTLARTTILATSTAGSTSAINFTGLVTVYNEVPSKQTVTADCFYDPAPVVNGSISTTYAERLPSGLILHWGIATTQPGGGVGVSFALANTVAIEAITANYNGATSGTGSYTIGIGTSSLSATTFWAYSAANVATAGIGFYWSAVGR